MLDVRHESRGPGCRSIAASGTRAVRIAAAALAVLLLCGCVSEPAQQRTTATDCDYAREQASRQVMSAAGKWEDAEQQPAYANVAAAVRSSDAAARRALDLLMACEGTTDGDAMAALLGIIVEMGTNSDALHAICSTEWPGRECGR